MTNLIKTKEERKDLIPYIIICVVFISSFLFFMFTGFKYVWHWLPTIILLPLSGFLFTKFHQLGVLVFGFTLLLGCFNFLSFVPLDIGFSYKIEMFGSKYTFFNMNPIILIFLIIHVVISKRYYYGIASKKYWLAMLDQVKSI